MKKRQGKIVQEIAIKWQQFLQFAQIWQKLRFSGIIRFFRVILVGMPFSSVASLLKKYRISSTVKEWMVWATIFAKLSDISASAISLGHSSVVGAEKFPLI